MKKFITKKYLRAMELKDNAIKTLNNKDGLSHTTEILLYCAAGAAIVLVVTGLFILLIKNDAFPGLADKLKEIFNYK